MAIDITQIEQYLQDMDLKYSKRNDETLVLFVSNEENEIMIIISLLEDGEFLRIRTVKHLDELLAEASEEKRTGLLQWMLEKNYFSKLGAWSHDPEDHDHHITVGHVIEDGTLTLRQFKRIYDFITDSLRQIPEMKEILGIDSALSAKEKKRQALLDQLQALDEDGI